MVHRPIPQCPFCKKNIAKAIYKTYDIPLSMRPIGDSFSHWEFEKHECEEGKEYAKKVLSQTAAGCSAKNNGA